jgi:hypothetical protein
MAIPLDPTGLLVLASSVQLTSALAIISIIFGIIILIKPNIIAYLIAIYLILTGIIALAGSML